jgi:hypothetical protein
VRIAAKIGALPFPQELLQILELCLSAPGGEVSFLLEREVVVKVGQKDVGIAVESVRDVFEQNRENASVQRVLARTMVKMLEEVRVPEEDVESVLESVSASIGYCKCSPVAQKLLAQELVDMVKRAGGTPSQKFASKARGEIQFALGFCSNTDSPAANDVLHKELQRLKEMLPPSS